MSKLSLLKWFYAKRDQNMRQSQPSTDSFRQILIILSAMCTEKTIETKFGEK